MAYLCGFAFDARARASGVLVRVIVRAISSIGRASSADSRLGDSCALLHRQQLRT